MMLYVCVFITMCHVPFIMLVLLFPFTFTIEISHHAFPGLHKWNNLKLFFYVYDASPTPNLTFLNLTGCSDWACFHVIGHGGIRYGGKETGYDYGLSGTKILILSDHVKNDCDLCLWTLNENMCECDYGLLILYDYDHGFYLWILSGLYYGP